MEERESDFESVNPKRQRCNESRDSDDRVNSESAVHGLDDTGSPKAPSDMGSLCCCAPQGHDQPQPSTPQFSRSPEGELSTRNSAFIFSSELSLESIRKMQAQFVDERNWNQFHTPRNLLLAMVGEVGELSELFQWRNEVPVGLTDWSESERTRASEELSDVLIYLIRLAEQCHVDLPSAVLRKMDLNRQKYPTDRVYGSSKKYNEYGEENSKDYRNGSL